MAMRCCVHQARFQRRERTNNSIVFLAEVYSVLHNEERLKQTDWPINKLSDTIDFEHASIFFVVTFSSFDRFQAQ